MKKAKITTGLVLLILLASLIPWPQATAITPQDQTISITDTHDDLFITETGIGIDSQLCHITDPNMDIRSFLVFRELDINFWEPLTNATLRFRTTSTLDFDADSSVTVYGMRYSDLQREGWLNPGWVLSVPLTSAHINVNTSQFSGQTWHEVNVTSIVEELIRSYDWDGDGADGTETGDAIGFVILGAEGHDTRWFIDYLYGTPSLATQLVIHWNHEVSPPVGYEDAEYIEEHGNYTIWVEYGVLENPYVWIEGTANPYELKFDYVGNGEPVSIAEIDLGDFPTWFWIRTLVRTSDGTLYVIYYNEIEGIKKVYVKKSEDEGANWIDETLISTKSGMENYDQKIPAMSLDSNDYLHAVWVGRATGDAIDRIYYSNFTDSWSEPLWISTQTTAKSQSTPTITVDSNDTIHIIWSGTSDAYPNFGQIWASNYTTSWSYPIRISTVSDKVQTSPTIEVDSNNSLHVAWQGFGAVQLEVYYTNYTTSWLDDQLKISTHAGMEDQAQSNPSVTIDSSDNIYVAWDGKAVGYFGNRQQIWCAIENGTWQTPVRISDYTGMDNSGLQERASMSTDSLDTIHVVWDGTTTAYPTEDIWYTNYTTSWGDTELLQTTGTNKYPKLQWANWHGATPVDKFLIVDENGTVVVDDCETVDCAEDWIDTEDPDPEDPNPPDWPETGYFIRFKMRLYFLAIGFGCLFGPILFFAWRRPSGYYIGAGFILMLIGLGFLLTIGQV